MERSGNRTSALVYAAAMGIIWVVVWLVGAWIFGGTQPVVDALIAGSVVFIVSYFVRRRIEQWHRL